MKLKPFESVADQIRRMGRTDFAAGVSRKAGQEAWATYSLARKHWLEGWDSVSVMPLFAQLYEKDKWLVEQFKRELGL